jgi:hypothetical protein
VTQQEVRELEGVLAETATGLWRLTHRLGDPADERCHGARRQLGRILESLADSGIRIDDHRDQRFHPGLAMEVVAYRPVPGLGHETVVEVERPSVYRNGTVIQRARVIVGTPLTRETIELPEAGDR